MASQHASYRFGPFSFDARSGELSNGSTSTRLAPQTAALLLALLQRAGDVVPRSVLQAELWPDSTVEFDQGLNFCVRQLRVALGDDADRPTYIETLPRRGYRFLAVVDRSAADDAQTVTTIGAAPAKPGTQSTRRWLLGSSIVVVATTLLAIALLWRTVRPMMARTSAASASALAILPFDAASTDTLATRYRDRLAEDLVVQLTPAAGAMNVLGPSSTSGLGTRTPVAEISERLRATYVLSGTATTDSAGVRIFAQLIRTSDGRHILARRFVDSTVRRPKSDGSDSIAAAIARGVVATIGAAPDH